MSKRQHVIHVLRSNVTIWKTGSAHALLPSLFTRGWKLFQQLVPFSNLLPGAIHDLVPMAGLLTSALDPNLQATYDLVLGHAIPVEDEKLEGDVLKTFVVGDVKEEGLVENRVQRTLLDVGLLIN